MNTFTVGYFDDVLIHSNTWTKHIEDVTEVLKAIQNAGMTLNINKCLFERANVDFLGFEVGLGRIEPDKEKLRPFLTFLYLLQKNK